MVFGLLGNFDLFRKKTTSTNNKLIWLVVSTHLKNFCQNGFIFPNFRAEHKKSLKPPPRKLMSSAEKSTEDSCCVSHFFFQGTMQGNMVGLLTLENGTTTNGWDPAGSDRNDR